MEHGNMLAIVGSPGSGKTTLAVKLAAEIAKKKKNVVVVCSDPFVPSVPFLLPYGYGAGGFIGCASDGSVIDTKQDTGSLCACHCK